MAVSVGNTVRRSSGPTLEPVTLDEAKTHLRVTGVQEDAYIVDLIRGAREDVSKLARLAFVNETWELRLDSWPTSPIYLTPAPLYSVTHIKYYDTAGTVQTWATTEYKSAMRTDRYTAARGPPARR